MHILLLTQRLRVVGGHEAYVHAQARILASRGHDVTVATQSGEAFENWPADLEERVQYVSLESVPRLLHGLTKRHRGELEKFVQANPSRIRDGMPEIAFTHGGVDRRLVGYVAGRLPTVHFVHSPGDYCPSGTRFFLRRSSPCRIRPGTLRCLASGIPGGCFFGGNGQAHGPRMVGSLLWRFRLSRALVYPSVDAIVAYAPHVTRELEVLFGGDPSLVRKISVLFPPLFAETNGHDHRHLRDANLGDRRILFVGRLQVTKGVDDVIRALQFVQDPCMLTIVGEGPQKQDLKALATQVKPRHDVQFVGWCSQEILREHYRAHNLLVIPSKWPEPFGLVGPEAMMHGLPVIAYDVGGISDWLAQSRAGYLVERGNVEALGKAIDRALQDRVGMKRMKQRAISFTREHFSTDEYVRGLTQILKQVLGGCQTGMQGAMATPRSSVDV